MAELQSFEDIDAWISEKSVRELRQAVALENLTEVSARVAKAWLVEHDQAFREVHEAEMLYAAKRSASAAWWSARMAFASFAAMLAMLAGSFWR